MPQHLARRQIVASDTIGSANDELRSAIVFDDDRRRPRRYFVTSNSPKLRACSLVKRNEKRLFFVILVDHKRLAVNRWRTSFAVSVFGMHLA